MSTFSSNDEKVRHETSNAIETPGRLRTNAEEKNILFGIHFQMSLYVLAILHVNASMFFFGYREKMSWLNVCSTKSNENQLMYTPISTYLPSLSIR